MRKIRFISLAFIGFCTTLVSAFFTPSTFINRTIATAMCTLLSFQSSFCAASLSLLSDRVMAANPLVMESKIADNFANLLADRSGEFDDDPSPSSNGGSVAPPYPQQPSPNTPLRRPDFDDDIKQTSDSPNNLSTGQSITKNYPVIEPSFRKISNNSFELELASSEGCKFVTTLKKQNDSINQDLIKFVAPNPEICGSKPFSARIQPDGTKIEVKLENSPEILVAEKISDHKVRLTYQNADGKVEAHEFPIQKKEIRQKVINKYLYQDKIESKDLIAFSSKTCDFLNKTCSQLGLLTGAFSLVEASAAAFSPVIATFVLSNPPLLTLYGAFKAASEISSFGCWFMFGGIPPLPFFPEFNSKVNVMEKMANASLEYASAISGAVGATGQPDPNNPSKYSELTGWLDKPLNDFRNQIGFNPCGEKPSTQTAQKPRRPKSNAPLKQGKSYGDPHLITFDGYRYSFQMVGEFTLVKAKDDDFEIQVRQGAVPGRQLSLNTGVAMRVGNSRVAFYSKDFPDGDTSTQLRVDGKPTQVDSSLSLPGGGTIARSGGDYIVQWETGEQVQIHNITVAGSTFMNVSPAVPEESGRYIGLLGNLNGDPSDDLRTRNGNVIATKDNSNYGQLKSLLNSVVSIPVGLSQVETLFFDQLYKDFGNSWRISQGESLFDYAQGQTTETFTKRNFPSSYTSLSSFLPPQLRQAEEICQRAGVPGDLLDGCIFDVANTGEAGFAQAALNAVTGIVKDRVQNEIRNRIPVSIPGLPF